MLAARENARSVRETISSEMWQQINSLYLLIAAESRNRRRRRIAAGVLPQGPHGAATCFRASRTCTMSHNEAWHFIRLGTRLERADKTTRMLDVKYFILLPSVSDVGTPYDDIQWSAVLKSVSGFEMYRKLYGRISPERIVEFLLLDSEFPRAVRYCIGLADQSLHAITGAPRGHLLLPLASSAWACCASELDYAAGGCHPAGGPARILRRAAGENEYNR